MALKVVVRAEVAEAVFARYRSAMPPVTLSAIAVGALVPWVEQAEAPALELATPQGIILKAAHAPFPEPLSPLREGRAIAGQARISHGNPFSFVVPDTLERRVRAATWWLGLRLSWVVDEALALRLGVNPQPTTQDAQPALDASLDGGLDGALDSPTSEAPAETVTQGHAALRRRTIHHTPSPDDHALSPSPRKTPKP